MNLTKKLTAWFLTLVMVVGLIPQTVFAQETVASLLQYEVTQEINEDKTEATISIKFTETETIQLEKVTLPDGTEKAEDLSSVTYKVSENGNYDFKVNYVMDGTPQEETIPVEVSGLEEKKAEVVANQNIELDVDIQLKGATFFDGTPWTGTTQTILEYGIDVPYNGWQLMKLEMSIPYQDGLDVKAITPSATSEYPDLSKLEKDDKKSLWTYDFYFYNNGTYEFTIDYTLNGENKTITTSFTIDGLVSIKNAAMRRHLIHNYGEFSGFDHQDGQYVTKDFLSRPLYDPWGNLSFDFGKDTDNGSTAQYTTSLDGLQYLTNIHGMDLYICQSLVPGETIAPVTQGYYPQMKRFRVSNINERPRMPSHAYNGELVAQCIANMPALQELVMNGTGFSDCTVFRKLTEGNLYYLQAMANNIVSLDGIESQPNLSNVNIGQNKIKSIEPLSKLNQINLVNLNYNQVFDLKPLNLSLDKDATFAGNYQEITYDRTVISPLQNGEYTVELPMPIDIDGTLTNTSSVSLKFANGTTKTYSTTQSEGKTYISIPQGDVDSSQENPFEGAEFKFSFDNNNGTDLRTKGQFNGNLTFKVSPIAKNYHVVYDFISGTRGKSLPDEIVDLLPIDSTKYYEGDTITAKNPTQLEFEVSDGVWTFEGYDADSKTANADNVNEDGNIQFTGTWIFETKKYDVSYKFESTNTDKELPKEIIDQLPTAGSVEHGKTINAPSTKFDDVKVTDGVWVFKGWTPTKYENVKSDVEFVGKWEFKKNASIVNLVPTISASDKTLTVGDSFDPLKDVTATDREDGDIILTIKNAIKNEVDTTKPGVYEVTYKVTDSKGASTVKTIYVTVNPKMEGLNQIPVINAEDKTLTVGDSFDPLKDVTATDKEDGDITKEIEILNNEVDINKAGVYEVTYKVTDSQGASTVKTIKVTVKAKETPVVPSEPNKPNDSNKPIIVPDTSVNDKNPQTGDSTNMILWSLLFITSSVGLVGIYRKKRKMNQ